MELDTEHFKKKLLEEKVKLEKELKSVGRINPDNPKDWEPVPQKMDILESDRNETADRIEGYEENTAILYELETRYNNILRALKKIESSTYGICEIGHKPIKIARLEANPAARTCKEHFDQEINLPA